MKVALGVIAAALGLAACGGLAGRPAATQTSVTPTPAVQSSGPVLSSGQQAFVTAAEAALSRDGYASQPAAMVLKDGNETCNALRGGMSPAAILALVDASHKKLARDLTVTARRYLCPDAVKTIEYVVTGTPGADVTYGPAGSNIQGSVPMHVTAELGNPEYYAINAQLQGGGTVSCEIKVDGAVISSSTATGGYNIANCEIGQDPVTGQWQNDN